MRTDVVVIAIDPGVKTGFAVKSANNGFSELCTLSIYAAQERVLEIADANDLKSVIVCIEDCRLRKWVDASIGKERMRGIGSVERDCSLWQEFCERNGLIHVLVKPSAIATKMDKWDFAAATDHPYDTSEHARDAGMLARKYHRMLRTGEFVMPALKRPIKKGYPANRKLPKKPEKKPKAETKTATKKASLGSYIGKIRRYKR